MQTTFSPLSFGKSFVKIRSAVPENGCLVFLWRTEKNKKPKKTKKNICKTYTHPLHRWLRKSTCAWMSKCCHMRVFKTEMVEISRWRMLTVWWWTTSQCQRYHLSTGVLCLLVCLVLERRPRLRVVNGSNTTAAEGVVPWWERPQPEKYVLWRMHFYMLKGKKDKDVDLYSASRAPGTPNAHFNVTETDPPDRYLGHRPACKHSSGQWLNNRHRQRQPASRSPPS